MLFKINNKNRLKQDNDLKKAELKTGRKYKIN